MSKHGGALMSVGFLSSFQIVMGKPPFSQPLYSLLHHEQSGKDIRGGA